MSLTDNTLVKACEYFQLASNYMCKGRKKKLSFIFVKKLLLDETRRRF